MIDEIAVHESAHGVVAHKLGLHLDYITLNFDAPYGTPHAKVVRPHGVSELKDVIWLAAGRAANDLHQHDGDGDAGDREQINRILIRYYPSRAERAYHERRLRAEAAALVSKHHADILTIAGLLTDYRRMSGDQVRWWLRSVP